MATFGEMIEIAMDLGVGPRHAARRARDLWSAGRFVSER